MGIGNEICKALGLDGTKIARIEMTFTADEAQVVVHLGDLNRRAEPGNAFVETIKRFDLVERKDDSAEG